MIWKNSRINYLLNLYNSYKQASSREDKMQSFDAIARNKPLSDDLLGNIFRISPSYKDFEDERTIHHAFIKLHEAFNNNSYMAKKYLNPKYFIKDLFFIPANVFGFLVSYEFKKFPSFLFSCIAWLATILISAYAQEIRTFIDGIFQALN
ncbi:hypothetical protein [Gracilibacillus salinarum]|uniref:Uncharacterized protein n=1 Tax=Gracilibacillus salinarum TaxID=2932255 RepID=A0ABY4GN38_9BACI|nr:hypothetical protein [Gracilibacillus salinarum]UOQ85659.1 hypothetical protein MUN87_01770 [Gracilibacillus salinarum]